MEIELISKGKYYFYRVLSDSGETYEISAKFNCTCEFMSSFGHAQKKICKHIRAVLSDIIGEK